MIFFLSLLLLISTFSFLSLAPFVPTKTRDLERIQKILDLEEGERFLEIGTWTAKVSLFLAKNTPGAHITGIELSPFFYLLSKIRVFFSPLKNIDILYGDALHLDMSHYDIIYVFWLPETITKKIAPKLEKEMTASSRFFSYCFQMDDPGFLEIQHKESHDRLSLYEYRKKDPVSL